MYLDVVLYVQELKEYPAKSSIENYYKQQNYSSFKIYSTVRCNDDSIQTQESTYKFILLINKHNKMNNKL